MNRETSENIPPLHDYWPIKEAIAQNNLLTPQAEYSLGKMVVAGRKALNSPGSGQEEVIRRGKEAQETLILHNLRFALEIALKYQNCSLPLADIIQASFLGLMKTAKNYDPEKGRFTTYAHAKIRREIEGVLIHQGNAVPLPYLFGQDLNKVRQFLSSYHGESLSVESIAETFGFTLKKARLIIFWLKNPVSLDVANPNLDNSEPFGTVIATQEPSPEETLLNKEAGEELRALLNNLPAREAKVLGERFGFTSGGAKTLEEIGENFGLCRERIRQIQRSGLKKLRSPHRLKALQEIRQSQESGK